MNEEEVVDLMDSSRSESEWNDNAAKVKQACGGFPVFWYRAIVASGLINRVAARWGGDGMMKVSSPGPRHS